MLFNFLKSSFDKSLYLTEMNVLIEKAFERITKEYTDYKIYTISIWTDPNAAISSINFDSKTNSIKTVEKSNQWSKKYYDEHIANKDFEQANLFKPINGTRLCNPAEFELRDFEEFKHKSIEDNWEEISSGKCWTKLNPALLEIGNIAFEKTKKLNLESDFELAVNSNLDWYDKTWSR